MDSGYNWVPTDFARFISEVQYFADVTKVIANDVYRHLPQEDIDAIEDGRFMKIHDTWLAREFKKAPPLWKSLMEGDQGKNRFGKE